jgi:hypothetical protein
MRSRSRRRAHVVHCGMRDSSLRQHDAPDDTIQEVVRRLSERQEMMMRVLSNRTGVLEDRAGIDVPDADRSGWMTVQTAAYRSGLSERANPEQCLLATRGKPPRQAKDVRRLVVEKRREHSRKPDRVRERIERLVGGPYLELFGRQTKPGWDCWGNQGGLFDHGAAPTRRQPSRLVDAPALLL